MSTRNNKSQQTGLKLNFLQKFSNFIQESITDRKHHNSSARRTDNIEAGSVGQRFSGGFTGNNNRHDEYSHGNNHFMRMGREQSDLERFDRYDRMSNEDELFYRNLSSNKVKNHEDDQ